MASNGTVQINGNCLDITGASYTNGTLIEEWTCNGGANQQWLAVNGELVNPASGMCLDDPAFNTDRGHPARPVGLQRRHPTSSGRCRRRQVSFISSAWPAPRR